MKKKRGGHKDNRLTCETCPQARIVVGFKSNEGFEILRRCPMREFAFLYDTDAICHNHPGWKMQSPENEHQP